MLLLVLILAAPAATQAQSGGWMPGPAHDSAVAVVLSRFRPGQPIRVALLRNRWSGRFEAVRGDTLFFGPPHQPPMGVRFNAVDTVWRRGFFFRRWRRVYP